MKRIINLITALIMILISFDLALAGDSVSIAISCTIPAIPGVNAPLLNATGQKQHQITQESQNELKQGRLQEELNSTIDSPAFIVQEDAQNKTRLTKNIDMQETVKTIYSR